MEKSTALTINNEIIFGRDKLWLESLQHNRAGLIIQVEADFEEGTRNVLIAFSMPFFFSCTELDTYEKSGWSSSWLESESNFEWIENSELLNHRVKIRDGYSDSSFNHYRLSTYDDIIDVIAEKYVITVE